MSPYRQIAQVDDSEKPPPCEPDGELLPFGLIFWVASVVRTMMAIGQGDFGVEAALALLASIFLPYAFLRGCRLK